MENKNYLVSFGDSDKYRVSFPGTLDQFLNSDKLRELKDEVMKFLKEKLPAANFDDLINLDVTEDDGKPGYPTLDTSHTADLLKDVVRQAQVKLVLDNLNLNAPFDIL